MCAVASRDVSCGAGPWPCKADTAEGVAQIRQAFAVYPHMEPGLYRSYFLGLLAEACGQVGQPEAGLRAVAEALTLVATTQVRWWEAELSRLQGVLQLQLQSPDVSQAERCFQQALAVARRQQAKSLELRAALSLVGCGSSRASRQPPMRSWRRSTAGSPRVSTPPTCGKRRYSWRR